MHAASILLALCAPALDMEDGLYSALVSPGDLDRDGVADVVAAMRTPAAAFGGSGRGGDTLRALSGADGSVLWECTRAGGLGSALAAAGDLDGDGIGDVAAALRPKGSLEVLVLSGATGEPIRRMLAPGGVEDLGRSLASGLDATGDGVPDLLVGARDQAVLFDGATGAGVATAALFRPEAAADAPRPAARAELRPVRQRPDGSIVAEPCEPDTGLGAGVALVPDLDRDGRAEIAVGTGTYFGPAFVHVFYSADAARSRSFESPGWCLLVLDDVDGDGAPELVSTLDSLHVRVFGLGDGRLLWEVDYSSGYMNGEGTSLALLPDLDGDGAPDLAVGANETGMDCDPGFVAMLSGRTGKDLRPPLTPEQLDVLGRPAAEIPGLRSGLDVALLPGMGGAKATHVAVHVSHCNEVCAVSLADGSVRWRVALAAPR